MCVITLEKVAVDAHQFDALVSRLSSHLSRRSLGLVGVLGASAAGLGSEVEAKKKKKKGKKGKKGKKKPTTQAPTTPAPSSQPPRRHHLSVPVNPTARRADTVASARAVHARPTRR
jgi:hypothetical protein